MVLRLDPRLPVVWRTPTSMQFGVSQPPVILEHLDLASEKMIAALGSGISRSGLGMIGRSAGASDADIEKLLARIASVLLQPTEHTPTTVVVTGVGRLADRLASLLADAGLRVLIARTAEAAENCDAELAIAVAHFVLDPALHGLWLRRDVPHCAIVLCDTAVTIGPLVRAGETACLYCLQRHASDADPAWPAIASQLWGRRSATDNELLASEVAAIVAREISALLGGRGGVLSDQLEIDAATGFQSRKHFEIHPDCGCVIPGGRNRDSGVSAEVRPEIGSAFARGRQKPTKGTAVVELE